MLLVFRVFENLLKRTCSTSMGRFLGCTSTAGLFVPPDQEISDMNFEKIRCVKSGFSGSQVWYQITPEGIWPLHLLLMSRTLLLSRMLVLSRPSWAVVLLTYGRVFPARPPDLPDVLGGS